MSTSTTKTRFLSGGSQPINPTELHSSGVVPGSVLVSNTAGGWTTALSTSIAAGGAHASTHLSGGTDPIDAQLLRANGIAVNRLLISNGLGGWTTILSSSISGGGGAPAAHSASHMSGGSDPLNAQDLGARGLSANRLLISNANGGWTTVASSSIASSGVSSDVIWKWNEVDTSEFVVAHTGAGNPSLTFQNSVYGKTIRVQFGTKNTGDLATVIALSSSAALSINKDSENRYRYTIQFKVVDFSGTIAQWYGIGPAFLCNKSLGPSFYGLGAISLLGSNTGRVLKIQSGSYTGAGATPIWGQAKVTGSTSAPVIMFESEIIAVHSGANPPAFRNLHKIYGESAAAMPLVGDLTNDAYYVTQLGAFGSGWNTEVLNNIGIAIVGNTGNTANQYFDITDICVRRHTMDSSVLVNGSASFSAHASTHLSGAADPINIQFLQAAGTAANQIVMTSGTANGSLVLIASSTFALNSDFNTVSASYFNSSASFATVSSSFSPLSSSFSRISASFIGFSGSHASRHLSGGADPIDAQFLRANAVAINRLLISDGLGGWTTVASQSVGTPPGAPAAHASTHLSGASDPINVQFLQASGAAANQILMTSGTANASLVLIPSATFALTSDFNTVSASYFNSSASFATVSSSFSPLSNSFAAISSSFVGFSGSHAARHLSGAADPINVQFLQASGAAANQILMTSGTTNASLVLIASSTFALTSDFNTVSASYFNSSASFAAASASLATISGTFVNSSASFATVSSSFSPLSSSFSRISASFIGFSGSHAVRHLSGAADPINVQFLQASGAAANQILMTSGTANASLVLISSGTFALTSDFNTVSASYFNSSASFATVSSSFSPLSNSFAAISASFVGFSGSHAARHLSGGADPIDAQSLRANAVAINRLLISDGLGGWTTVASQSVGTPPGAPAAHASTHLSGASDPINVQFLQASGAAANQILMTSGTTNASLVLIASSTFALTSDFNTVSASYFNSSASFAAASASLATISGTFVNSSASFATVSSSFSPLSLSFSRISASFIGFSGSHATRHLSGAADPINVQFLQASGAAVNQILMTSGTANASLVLIASSTFALTSDFNTVSASYFNSSASFAAASASLATISGTFVNSSASFATVSSSFSPLSSSFSRISASFIGFSGSHAARHLSGAADPINVQFLQASGAAANQILMTSGTANASLVLIPSATFALTSDFNTVSASYFNSSASFATVSSSFSPLSNSFAAISASFVGFSGSHASRHLSGGTDPIDAQSLRANAVSINRLLISDGLGGWTTVASQSVGTPPGAPAAHASTHLSGASDPINIQFLQASGAAANQILMTSGTANASLVLISSATFALNSDFNTVSASYFNSSASFATVSSSFSPLSSSFSRISASFIGFSGSHASRHLSGGADPIDAQSLRGDSIAVNRLLISNGLGGWTTVASQSVGQAGGAGITSILSATTEGFTLISGVVGSTAYLKNLVALTSGVGEGGGFAGHDYPPVILSATNQAIYIKRTPPTDIIYSIDDFTANTPSGSLGFGCFQNGGTIIPESVNTIGRSNFGPAAGMFSLNVSNATTTQGSAPSHALGSASFAFDYMSGSELEYRILPSGTTSATVNALERRVQVGWLNNTISGTTLALTDQTNGIYFEISSSTTTWRICSASGSVYTRYNTSTNINSSSWTRLAIIVTGSAAPTASFFINDALVGVISSTVPSRFQPVFPGVKLVKLTGAVAHSLFVDYMELLTQINRN